MRVGVVTELKADEHRVALTPAGTRELVERGHDVLVERGAGEGSAFSDTAYAAAGATLAGVDDVWAAAELLLKVKEPLPEEYGRLRDDLCLFTYLHLAADERLTRALVDSGATCIAYETVQTPDGRLPLLAPMSEVAGRLATQMGAWALEKAQGGKGILLGGVPGVPPARVLVLGGGIVGFNAALIAVGMQADVWVLERSVERMRELEVALGGRITLAMSSRLQIEELLPEADLVIGAVLIPGARAPKLVTGDMLGRMKAGSVLVDVAIDQGGCFETSRPTTHSSPTFEIDGIVHYCVANMPGAVPITSTKALTNVTLPYVERLADLGVREAVSRSDALALGVNVAAGRVTYEAVAHAHGLPHVPLAQAMPLAAA
ncbi:MAG: alanine dehydrogenase [Thermoleophilia bacterium]|nr:alanine dehydrogenase [Thermoleophilia bacterium]